MTRKRLDLKAAHPWLVDTLVLMSNRRHNVTIEQIAEAADASPSWVNQLLKGDIADPSVNKIGRIFDFLQRKASEGRA